MSGFLDQFEEAVTRAVKLVLRATSAAAPLEILPLGEWSVERLRAEIGASLLKMTDGSFASIPRTHATHAGASELEILVSTDGSGRGTRVPLSTFLATVEACIPGCLTVGGAAPRRAEEMMLKTANLSVSLKTHEESPLVRLGIAIAGAPAETRFIEEAIALTTLEWVPTAQAAAGADERALSGTLGLGTAEECGREEMPVKALCDWSNSRGFARLGHLCTLQVASGVMQKLPLLSLAQVMCSWAGCGGDAPYLAVALRAYMTIRPGDMSKPEEARQAAAGGELVVKRFRSMLDAVGIEDVERAAAAADEAEKAGVTLSEGLIGAFARSNTKAANAKEAAAAAEGGATTGATGGSRPPGDAIAQGATSPRGGSGIGHVAPSPKSQRLAQLEKIVQRLMSEGGAGSTSRSLFGAADAHGTGVVLTGSAGVGASAVGAGAAWTPPAVAFGELCPAAAVGYSAKEVVLALQTVTGGKEGSLVDSLATLTGRVRLSFGLFSASSDAQLAGAAADWKALLARAQQPGRLEAWQGPPASWEEAADRLSSVMTIILSLPTAASSEGGNTSTWKGSGTMPRSVKELPLNSTAALPAVVGSRNHTCDNTRKCKTCRAMHGAVRAPLIKGLAEMPTIVEEMQATRERDSIDEVRRLVEHPEHGDAFWGVAFSNGEVIGNISVEGVIVASPVHARDSMEADITDAISTLIGVDRAATVVGEIARLVSDIITLQLDLALTVKLLGGERALEGTSVEETASGALPGARWGSATGGTLAADLPTAMLALAGLLHRVHVQAGGGVDAPKGQPDFGLVQYVRKVVACFASGEVNDQRLDAEGENNVRRVMATLFTSIGQQALARRRRAAEPKVDIAACVRKSLELDVRAARQRDTTERTAEAAARAAVQAMVGKTKTPPKALKPDVTPGAPLSKRKEKKASWLEEQRLKKKAKLDQDALNAAAASTVLATGLSASAAAVEQPSRGGKQSGGAAVVFTWEPNSLTCKIGKQQPECGAIRAYQTLCREAHPGLDQGALPCAWHDVLDDCRRHKDAKDQCRPCEERERLGAKAAAVPPGAKARMVKASTPTMVSLYQWPRGGG